MVKTTLKNKIYLIFLLKKAVLTSMYTMYEELIQLMLKCYFKLLNCFEISFYMDKDNLLRLSVI